MAIRVCVGEPLRELGARQEELTADDRDLTVQTHNSLNANNAIYNPAAWGTEPRSATLMIS